MSDQTEREPAPCPPIFSAFSNDQDMLELIELFVSELPERVERVRAAWEERRLEELQRLAHQLKGASPSYGYDELGRIAARLERSLVYCSQDAIEAQAGTICEEIDELVALCNRVIAGGP